MATGISWTDETWNPVTGCTRVSAGCDHCYAFQLHDQRHVAWKRGEWPNAPAQYHRPFSEVQLFTDRLQTPTRWRKPRRVFVCSMADLFHQDVPDEFIEQVFITMLNARAHTFQVLTKRPERMRDFIVDRWIPVFASVSRRMLPNVWIGTSVEDQQRADERIPVLLQTPAAVRFISAEPLLGCVNLKPYLRPRSWGTRAGDPGKQPPLDWVIAGGESGPHARPCEYVWLRIIRDHCAEAGVPFHLKQLGGVRPGGAAILDGKEHKEFPK